MSRIHSITRLTGAALALLIGTGVYAAPPVAGLLAFAPVQLKDSGGGPLEQGVLTYQGKGYDVQLNGIGVGGAKGVKANVTGEVYGLNQVTDLEGPFVTELADAPPTEVSSDDLWLYSERGVSIRLHTDNPQITIASGSDIVMVQFGSGD
jgi:hypothetical protein